MTQFNEFLEEQLRDPVLKKEYDALEAEFSIMQALIDARKQSGLSRLGRLLSRIFFLVRL